MPSLSGCVLLISPLVFTAGIVKCDPKLPDDAPFPPPPPRPKNIIFDDEEKSKVRALCKERDSPVLVPYVPLMWKSQGPFSTAVLQKMHHRNAEGLFQNHDRENILRSGAFGSV